MDWWPYHEHQRKAGIGRNVWDCRFRTRSWGLPGSYLSLKMQVVCLNCNQQNHHCTYIWSLELHSLGCPRTMRNPHCICHIQISSKTGFEEFPFQIQKPGTNSNFVIITLIIFLFLFLEHNLCAYQSEASYGMRIIGDHYWERSCCILLPSKCYHIPTIQSLQTPKTHGKIEIIIMS